MPIYFLNQNDCVFPHPNMADSQGVLAIGGDLNPERLLLAYSYGIFPWFNEDDPIIWWSPDPRSVIYPGEVKITKSMRSYLKKYELKIDHSFEEVIDNCKKIFRKEEEGTWITEEMKEAYIELHHKGYAHSFEAWEDGELIGGLYGVSLGKCFFGESMFSKRSNASKFAFINLNRILERKGFSLIDCQVPNAHLTSMGCAEMPKEEYLEILKKNIFEKTLVGNWKYMG